MRCEHCHVIIDCKAERCPLCHAPLSAEGESAFPTPKTKRRLPSKFSVIYFLIAIAVNVSCLLLNLFVSGTRILWYIPVLVATVYLYEFIKIFLISKPRWHKAILAQLLIFTTSFTVIVLAFGLDHYVIAVWIPVVFIGSDLLTVIFMIKQGIEAPKYLSVFLLICVLGAIPTIFVFAFGLRPKFFSWIATGLSALLFFMAIIIGHKHIIHELKKTFHA